MEEIHVFAINDEAQSIVYTIQNPLLPIIDTNTRTGQITGNTEIVLNGNAVNYEEIRNIITSPRAIVRIEENGEIINRIEITI